MDTLTDMEMEEAAVLFEFNKRKIGSVSPGSSGTDDDELKVKRVRESSSPLSSEKEDKGSDYRESSERSSSVSSEEDRCDDHESTESSSSFSDEEDGSEDSDSEEVSSHLIRQSRNEKEARWFRVAKELVKEVVAYYNNEARNDKDKMEAVKIKLAMGQWAMEDMMYFICFDARLTPKDGKPAKETNCRSVLFMDTESDGPFYQVFFIKLGSLEANHMTKWTMECGNRSVLFSESMEKMERPLNNEEEDGDTDNDDTDDASVRAQEFYMEEYVDNDDDNTDDDPVRDQEFAQEAVSDDNKKEEDVDTDSDVTEYDLVRAHESSPEAVDDGNKKEEDVDSDNDDPGDYPIMAQKFTQEAVADDNKKEEEEYVNTDSDELNTPFTSLGIDTEICPRIQEFAAEAVADYNSKAVGTRMELVEVKEAFFRAVAAEEYHINFEARLLDKVGNVTEESTCQAVVSKEFGPGPVTVWFLRFGPPVGTMDNWCKDLRCLCVFPDWKPPSKLELLKFKYPEWYPSSDDERELEDENIKLESSNQPPASKLIWRDRWFF